MFHVQSIINEIAKTIKDDRYAKFQGNLPDDQLYEKVTALAKLLPLASGDIAVNGFTSLDLKKGRILDFDALYDEMEVHLDKVNDLADKMTVNYLIAEHQQFNTSSEHMKMQNKANALLEREHAVLMMQEVGYSVMDRKITYRFDEVISQDMATQILQQGRMEECVDFRVSGHGKQLEVWAPYRLAKEIMLEMTMASSSGMVPEPASAAIEEIAPLIPGIKDWEDMEKRLERKRSMNVESDGPQR